MIPLRRIPDGIGTETHRILSLPWRQNDVRDMSDVVSRLFLLPNRDGRLFPVQAQALVELSVARGGVVMAGVGAGKTLTSILAPTALGVDSAILLVPASLVVKTRQAIDEARKDWRVIADLTVWSYESLSLAKNISALSDRPPAALICDECHNLRNLQAARTRRVASFLRDSGAVFVGLTGTVMRRGVADFAHLTAWALREQSPVPRPQFAAELDAWDRLTAPDVLAHNRPQLGGFRRLMTDEDHHVVQNTVRRRLTGTVGVVATDDVSVTVPLTFSAWDQQFTELDSILKEVARTWTTPTGDAIADAAQLSAVSSQLSSGFVYRWEWPNGVVNRPWLAARYNWRRYCSEVIDHAGGEVDSELTTANMLERLATAGKLTPLRAKAWAALVEWRAVRSQYTPNSVPVWMTMAVMDVAEQWLTSSPEGSVLWFQHRATGDELARRGCWVGSSGDDAKVLERFNTVHKVAPTALSIAAHGTGKNLQAGNIAWVLDPPASGVRWEQLVGRHHRHGQRDPVHVIVSTHTEHHRKALAKAKADALAIEQTTGNPQRLNLWTV